MSQPNEHFEDWWHDRTEGIGLATALDARQVYQTTTRHHRIEVLAHDGLGWVLAIDGVLQGVERDSGDREMLIHVPLLGRRRRQCRVLLLGGGDGAKLHEMLRHPFVTEVVLCEPDATVIAVGTDYLGFGADLRDARVTVRELAAEAALAYSREHDFPFDLIVAARPGSAGVASEVLCRGLADCLAEDGVIVDSDLVVLGLKERRWYGDAGASLRSAMHASGHFGPVEHYYTVSQLSPGGFIGFFLYSRDRHSYAEPQHDFCGLSYNPRLHRAAFALPSFWEDLIGGGTPPCR
jgi:spermidine synthase